MSTAVLSIQDAIFEQAFATIRRDGVRSRYDNFIGGRFVSASLFIGKKSLHQPRVKFEQVLLAYGSSRRSGPDGVQRR